MLPAIRAENLTKHYRLGKRGTTDRNLTETIGHFARSAWSTVRRRPMPDESNNFFALQDVSFEIEPGEVVGIIGRNGAGKSTLLKLLSRIVEPSAGWIEFRGRMGSLLEVGTGFHPELTGRENVYLNGSILGMSRSEIDAKFDQIVEFAEISRFLDTPVKRYSSGMYVRLAFAIAAHLEPEILILDEVLAVGDANFQKKCLGRMKEVANEGRTVLFVSHDMAAVRRLCNRGILLSQGRVAYEGPIDEAVSRYLSVEGDVSRAGNEIDLRGARRNAGNNLARFVSARYSGPNGGSVVSGQPMEVILEVETDQERIADSISVLITDRSGYRLINADTIAIDRIAKLKPGRTTLTMHIDPVALYPGNYLMGFWLAKRPANPFDFIETACEFEVVPAEGDGIRPNCDGIVRVNYDLRVS